MVKEGAAILNWLNEDLHATGACSSSQPQVIQNYLISWPTYHKVMVPKNTLLPEWGMLAFTHNWYGVCADADLIL